MSFGDLRPALRAATAAAGGIAGYPLPSTALVFAPSRRLFRVQAEIADPAAVALTFDDGPHPEGTPRVLELLRAANAQATFFLVGEQVERFPELAREIVDAGHEVAVHCFRHVNLMRRGPATTRDDLDRAAATIGEATSAELRHYRPPYGILTLPALRHARARGWQTVLWRHDGRDWRADATPESIAARLLGKASGGEVLLLHDADWYASPRSWERTAGALELVLERLRERGLRARSL
ncbi:MAG TPA: polysaccharide deacetylase family protein [Gaiellaceae bacterium]|nr:polysaccharide deacetylase family protein [Gaiellaceae bacterium]